MSKNRLGTLRIGDMSQPRGGPMPFGHASHQVGLDVDIWFKPLRQRELNSMTWDDLENVSAPSMLTPDQKKLDKKMWNSARSRLLKHVTTQSRVERVFVHPVIKQELCRKYSNQKWLAKVRPWWGHHRHFHVRLACPKGNKDCEKQKPIPKKIGCGKTLNWWGTKDSEKELADRQTRLKKRVVKLPKLCLARVAK